MYRRIFAFPLVLSGGNENAGIIWRNECCCYNEIQIIPASIEYIHEFIEIKSTSLLMCIYTLRHSHRRCKRRFLIFNSVDALNNNFLIFYNRSKLFHIQFAGGRRFQKVDLLNRMPTMESTSLKRYTARCKLISKLFHVTFINSQQHFADINQQCFSI